MNSTRLYSLIPISLQPDVVDVSKNSSWTYCYISRAFFDYLFFYFTYSFPQKITLMCMLSQETDNLVILKNCFHLNALVIGFVGFLLCLYRVKKIRIFFPQKSNFFKIPLATPGSSASYL